MDETNIHFTTDDGGKLMRKLLVLSILGLAFYLMIAQPIPGAIAIGILLLIGGYYMAWRFGQDVRRRRAQLLEQERQKWQKEREMM